MPCGMTRTNALLSAVLIATLAACGRDPAIPSSARDLAMEQVGFGTYRSTQFMEKARLIIHDQQTWQQAWAKIDSQSEPPATDFETQMIVLAAMGSRTHGGFTIALNDIAATRDTLYVSVLETSPGGTDCVYSALLVAPVALTRVERVDDSVQFLEHTQTTTNCR